MLKSYVLVLLCLLYISNSSVLCRPLLGSEPAVVCVEGVQCMNDDPTAVDVLYARIFLSDKSDRFVLYIIFLFFSYITIIHIR